MKGSSRVMEKSDSALHLEASFLVREVWKGFFIFCCERINDNRAVHEVGVGKV